MRLLLAFIVIIALILTLWVFVGGVPMDPPSLSGEEHQVENGGERISLSDPRAEPEARVEVEAEEMIPYRVVDGESGRALPHAEIFAIKSGELLAECDEDGRTELSHTDPGQLYYLADGYLLGFFLPDRAQLLSLKAQAESNDVTIELYRDEFSFPVEFDFRLPDGEKAEGVEFLLELREPDELAARFVKEVQSRSASMRRAWDNEWKAPKSAPHLKALPSNPRNAERLSGARQRLYLAGDYRITAIAKGGWRFERKVWIGAETGSLKLILNLGNTISGRVFDSATTKPLNDVLVVLDRAPLGGRVTARCDEDGWFTFGSLGTELRSLRLTHLRYQEVKMLEIEPGSELSITMTPLPSWELQGRIVGRGNGMPIMGARIGSSSQQATQSDQNGWFTLALYGRSTDQVSIRAEGYYSLSVAVGPGAEQRDYVLVPDQPEARVEVGMTSILGGRVLHPGGMPAAGMDLRLSVDGSWLGPKEKTAAMQNLGLLRQGLFSTPGEVTCDADGNFTIECGKPGLVILQPMDGESPPFKIQVVLGQRYENLVIYTKN